MAELIVVARVEVKEELLESTKVELLKLLEPTRKEEGCIQYDLHQDNEDSKVFIFFERWESEEALDTHMKTTHIKEYIKATKGAVTSFVVNKMHKL